MAAIRTAVVVDASREEVWSALADLASHPIWMTDAVGLEFEDDRRSGMGTVMLVDTRVGPFRLTDRLEVTEWEEERAIGVDHRGVVQGKGRFDLAPMADGIRFTWTEQLEFPWRLGGPLAALVARPVLAAVWRRNLLRFKAMVETGVSDR